MFCPSADAGHRRRADGWVLRLRRQVHALAGGPGGRWRQEEQDGPHPARQGPADRHPAHGRAGAVRVLEQDLQGAPRRLDAGEGRRRPGRLAAPLLGRGPQGHEEGPPRAGRAVALQRVRLLDGYTQRHSGTVLGAERDQDCRRLRPHGMQQRT